MAKIKEHQPGIWAIYCPGCEERHLIPVVPSALSTAVWRFDGNVEFPTFAPSINLKTGRYADPAWPDPYQVSMHCHFFVQSGIIKYLPDCSHKLAGKKCLLPDIE